MTEKARGWLVVVLVAAGVIISFQFGLRPYFAQRVAVEKILEANSTWTVTLQAYNVAGPISTETYRLHNDNGKSTMFFSATNREGTLTKQFPWPGVPLQGPEGTFLFELLRSEGIWELDDKSIRPNPKNEYVVEVEQTLGDEGGRRAFSFSDPEYWATTSAKEYRFRLPASGAISGIGAQSAGSVGVSLRDPRYLNIIRMIKQFGPTSVLQAENTIRQELAASNRAVGVSARGR